MTLGGGCCRPEPYIQDITRNIGEALCTTVSLAQNAGPGLDCYKMEKKTTGSGCINACLLEREMSNGKNQPKKDNMFS